MHPVNGKSYTNFLLWHPRDHVRARNLGRAAKGASIEAAEFPLTGCSERKGEKGGWACPHAAGAANPGVVRATPAAEWRALSQINGTAAYRDFSPRRIATGVKACNDAGACAHVVRTTHSL